MKIRTQFRFMSGIMILIVAVVVIFEIAVQFINRSERRNHDYTVSCLNDVFEMNLLVHELLLYSDIERPYEQLAQKIEILAGRVENFQIPEQVFPFNERAVVEASLKSMQTLLGYLHSARESAKTLNADSRANAEEIRQRIGAQLLQKSQILHGAFLLLRSQMVDRSEKDDFLRSLAEIIVLTLLLFITTVYLILFGQRITESLRNLETGALEFSRGNRDFKFPVRQAISSDEFDTVQEAFNEMLTSLQKALREIQNQNKELETLLYVVSHDLSEPLRSMEFFSQAVKERYEKQLDATAQDYLARSVKGARRMKDLLGEILKVSRVRQLQRPENPISGTALVEGALTRLQDTLQKKKAKVQVHDGFPDLFVDLFWGVEAMYNLINNALKFTREGEVPDIEIHPYSVSADGREAGFVVADRGPGVPPEIRDKIFGLFQRGVGREVEGIGAGLAIVKAIAGRYDGRVWVEDREGGGSNFILTFKR